MKNLILGVLLGGLFLLISCAENENTDVVNSGTYQGVAEKVKPGEKEIYVKTSDDKLVELYFTDETKVLTSDGETATFDAIKEKSKVEITVEKKGNKNVPLSVKILE
ncbi:MAG: hypothetical protein WD048_11385 [Chitinophagales bacterium]